MKRILIIFLVSLIVAFGATAIIYRSQVSDMIAIGRQKFDEMFNGKETETEPDAPSNSVDLKVKSLALDTTHAKLVFDFGERFTTDGLKVVATMIDGSTKEIAIKDCTILKPDMSKAGTVQVLVFYNDISVSYNITVKNPPDVTIPAAGSVKLEMEKLDLSNSTIVTKDSFINAGIAPGNVQRQYGRIFGYVPDKTTFRAYVAVTAPCDIKISFLTWGAASALGAHTYKFGDTVIDCETTAIPTKETTATSVIGTVKVTDAGTYLFEFGAGSDFDYVLFEVEGTTNHDGTPDVTIPSAGSVKLEMEKLDLSNSTIVTKDAFINAGIAPGNVQRQYGRIFGYVPDKTTFRAYVAVTAPCEIKISFLTWGAASALNAHTFKFGGTVIDCETTAIPTKETKVESVIGTVKVTEAGTYLFEFGAGSDFDYVLFEVEGDASFRKQVYEKDGYSLNYQIYTPVDISKENKRPLILFLHGAGERGNDNEAQLKNAIMNVVGTGEWANSVIIAPQCPADAQWVGTPWANGNYQYSTVAETQVLSAVANLIKEYAAENYVDTTRIYVVGLSMGGFGTWDIISRYPDLFAAAVPICGGGPTDKIDVLKNIPIYTFHGTDDTTVPYAGTEEMYNAITAAGGNKIIFHTFNGAGHGIWNQAITFAGDGTESYPSLESWLFAQKKETSSDVTPDAPPDVTIPATGSVKLEMEKLDLTNSTIVTKDAFINAGIAPGNVQRQYGRIFGYVPDKTIFRAYVYVTAPCEIKISFLTWGAASALSAHTFKFGDTVIDCEAAAIPTKETKVESVIGTVNVTEAGTYLFEFGAGSDFDYVLFEVVGSTTPDETPDDETPELNPNVTPDVTIPATGSVTLEMEKLDLSNSTIVTKDAFINAGIAPGNVQRQYGRIFGYVPDKTTFRAYVSVTAPCEIKISFLTWGAASALNAHTFKFGDTVIDCETTAIPTKETTVESVIGTVKVTEAGTYLFEFGAGSDFDYVLFEIVE